MPDLRANIVNAKASRRRLVRVAASFVLNKPLFFLESITLIPTFLPLCHTRIMAQSKMSPERLPRNQCDEKSVTQCTSCKQLFTVVVRKHHCVSCTKAFCGKCSRIRAQSEQGTLVRQRYCVLCEKNHTERNITRNGMIIRQQKHLKRMSSPQLTIPPSITFREAKKLMKESLLATTNDQSLDSISGSEFSHRPSISSYRRCSTMSPGDVYSYRQNHSPRNSYTTTELTTPDISYVDPDSSVIDGNTSILGTDLSVSDLNTVDLEQLDLSDIEHVEEIDSSREHDRGYTYNCTQKGHTVSPAQSEVPARANIADLHPPNPYWKSTALGVIGLFAVVATLTVVYFYSQDSYKENTSQRTGGVMEFAAQIIQLTLAVMQKTFMSVARSAETSTSSTSPSSLSSGAVVNIVVVVNNKASYGLLGLIKRTAAAVLSPLAEGLQNIDDIYI